MTVDLLHAVDELLQALADSQSRTTRRELAQVYDERTIKRMTDEAASQARAVRNKTEDRRKKGRDAQLARAAKTAKATGRTT
jgi:hypothetical protein